MLVDSSTHSFVVGTSYFLMSFAAFFPAMCHQTKHSSSDVLANLLDPCTPVHATSPNAYNLSMEDCPLRLTEMPPQL